MSRFVRLAFALSVAVAMLLAPARTARAHEFEPGVLALREVAPNRFSYAFTEPVAATASSNPLRPVEVRFPEGCRADGPIVTCGPEGLAGELSIEGIPDPDVPIVIDVTRLSGANEEHVLSGAEPRVVLGEERPATLFAWVKLGVEHVLTGFDHVAFVVALVFVARGLRRLLATVTGFTIAHSVSLALAVKDLVDLPGPPVEACIAASVVLVAREALASPGSPPTLARRHPWAVAFGFGLIHGLGFAGALRSIGLPQTAWLGPLTAFNVGIELGQLAVVVAVVLLLRFAVAKLARPALAERAVLGLVGGVSMFWLIERVGQIVTSSP